MACFLLPKTLCEEFEGIMAKFWWRKAHGKKKGYIGVLGINYVLLKEAWDLGTYETLTPPFWKSKAGDFKQILTRY